MIALENGALATSLACANAGSAPAIIIVKPVRTAAVRRFIARVGREHIQDLLALRRADQIGRCNEPERPGLLAVFRRRIEEILAREEALDLSDLAVDGNDLMEVLHIPPGREIGVVLRFLLEAVLDDPAQNQRGKLLEMARRFYRARVDPSP